MLNTTALLAGNPINFPHLARVGPLYEMITASGSVSECLAAHSLQIYGPVPGRRRRSGDGAGARVEGRRRICVPPPRGPPLRSVKAEAAGTDWGIPC